jgi:protein-export membrane protein SecD
MTRNNTIVMIIILIIFGLSLWTILPIESERLGRAGLHLGLDLVGGVDLVYQADFSSNATTEQKNSDMDRAVITIQRRIDKYGVAEPIIQQLGDDRIMVQLPGFTDIDAAKSLVEQTGFLEFREVELNAQAQPVYLSDYFDQGQPRFIDQSVPGKRIFVAPPLQPGQDYRTVAFLVQDQNGSLSYTDAQGDPADNTTLAQYARDSTSWIPALGNDRTPLTGELLDDAQPRVDTSQIVPRYVVGIEWSDQGTNVFDDVAARLYARPSGSAQRALGIFLDDSLISAPQILQPSYGGSAQIEGDFTPDETVELATLLASGSLPMPLKRPPLYQEKVSATLGANFIHLSWLAGLIGIILVMVFMTVYYRLPGLMSSLALLFYGAFSLAIFKLWPITLSLAGLGGFIVSVGIAVDANVLIFERMKEELRAGRTLGASIEAGFHRAWSAIRDSNVTTFIACIILYWLGSTAMASAAVMGFAVTLFIGAVVSMFTAITVTRTLLRLFVGTSVANKTWLFTVGGGKK